MLTQSQAMFQMGHGIVPETAGWATFIWTLGVLFGLTVALALALRSIIEKLRATWKATKGSLAVLIKKAGESVQGLWNTTKASTPPPHARQVQDEETASYTSGRESHVTSGVAQVARRRGS